MKKLIVWAVLSAAVAVLPSCGDDEGEGCSTPVISEVNYSPKNPSKSEEVTVTARIRNEHCPFQACVTYQVDSITGTWGNTTESYRSTDPVYSTVAGETYDFMAKIPATKLTGRKVRFMIEVTTQHRLYVSSDFEEYVVPGPIEPDPDQPGRFRRERRFGKIAGSRRSCAVRGGRLMRTYYFVRT